MSESRDPGYVGGIFNVVGVRPGDGFAYPGPTMPHMTYYSINFETTYEDIERYILPPPLQADRELPPIAQISFFVNPGNKGYDGRTSPYKAVILTGRARYQGETGMAGWEYVDGLYGDKSCMDVMGSWSVYFGMLKKFADINFLPVGVDEFLITVERQGVRVVEMRIRLGAEASAGELEAVEKQVAGIGQTLTVRELPNVDFTGLIEQTVCGAKMSEGVFKLTRLFSAEPVDLRFGHLDLDPLSSISVLHLHSAMAFEQTVESEAFAHTRILHDLQAVAAP